MLELSSIFYLEIMKKKFVDVLLSANEINLIKDGNIAHLNIVQFKEEFRVLTEGAYYMPGMAKAKDDVIKREKEKGFWLEFKFSKKTEFAEFSFDTLIIRVRPELDGFNVIRGNNGDFSGKTYYLRLATFTDDFYEYIESSANEQK